MKLEVGQPVEVVEEAVGRITITPLSMPPEPAANLEEILALIRPENVRGETDTAGPVGRGIW